MRCLGVSAKGERKGIRKDRHYDKPCHNDNQFKIKSRTVSKA